MGKKKSAKVKQFEKAQKVLMKHYKKILRRKGVTGVDVGYRLVDGKQSDEVAIRIHVAEKIPLEELHPSQIFSKKLDGVTVDLIERQKYKPTAKATGSASAIKLKPGSVLRAGHKKSEYGTLGLVVDKVDARGDRHPRLLTNAHVVLAGKTKTELPAGAKMVQKKNSRYRTVGTIVNVADSVFLTSFVDCALVTPVEGAQLENDIPGLDQQPTQFRALGFEDIGKVVHKFGAKTRKRAGVIDSISQIFSVPGNTFLMQVSIIPDGSGKVFSKAGDSGAVVVLDDAVVAILHGVDESGEIAIASPIMEVLAEMPFVMQEN